MSKNPFSQEEDNLQIWLKNSNEFKKLSQKEWIKSRQKIHFQSKFNIFMSTKNFFHKLNRTAVVGLGIVLFSTTVGVGAQIAAPDQYKPSSVFNFSANKQVDKNPYTALAPDENNYVANLENCDLAMKFPKSIENQNLYYSKVESNQKKDGDYYGINRGDEILSLLDIHCSEEKPKLKDDEGMSWNINIKGDWRGGVKVRELSANDLRERTGWLITQANITEVIEYSYSNLGEDFIYISFKYNSKYYTIESDNSSIKNVNNLVQIQFNSLVKNKISNNLPSIPTNKFNNGLDKIEASFAKGLKNAIHESNNPNLASNIYIGHQDNAQLGCVMIYAGFNSGSFPMKDTFQNIKGVNIEAKDIPEFKISDPQNSIKSIKMYKEDTESMKVFNYQVETKDGNIFTIFLNKPEVVQQTFDLKINFK
jgi:hypothetical protein